MGFHFHFFDFNIKETGKNGSMAFQVSRNRIELGKCHVVKCATDVSQNLTDTLCGKTISRASQPQTQRPTGLESDVSRQDPRIAYAVSSTDTIDQHGRISLR